MASKVTIADRRLELIKFQAQVMNMIDHERKNNNGTVYSENVEHWRALQQEFETCGSEIARAIQTSP